jgi:dolichol-phosphate mannosyltransferase
MRLTLVVPCFQEEESLRALATRGNEIPGDEVLFVDDGSTDGTAAALGEIASRDPRVRVLRHERNRGVGAAMRTGFAAATGDVTVVYDADSPYPLADVPRLVAAVEAGADLATATPVAADGVPGWRRFLTARAAAAYRRALGERAARTTCFTCAFRAYRTSWIRSLAFESDGFPAAAEILGRALLAGARVVEVESRLSPRAHGRSKMRLIKAVRGHRRVLRTLRGMTGR